MKVEPATRADIESFFGSSLPLSVRAFVAKEGDEIVALAGVFRFEGKTCLFGEITDKMREKYPVSMYKTARKIMSMQTGEVVAVAAQEVEASGRFLERLGFKKTEGELMIWQHLSQ